MRIYRGLHSTPPSRHGDTIQTTNDKPQNDMLYQQYIERVDFTRSDDLRTHIFTLHPPHALPSPSSCDPFQHPQVSSPTLEGPHRQVSSM